MLHHSILCLALESKLCQALEGLKWIFTLLKFSELLSWFFHIFIRNTNRKLWFLYIAFRLCTKKLINIKVWTLNTVTFDLKVQLFSKGHKSLKISHLFWCYWVKTTVLSKPVGDFSRFGGLLIRSLKVYFLDQNRLNHTKLISCVRA